MFRNVPTVEREGFGCTLLPNTVTAATKICLDEIFPLLLESRSSVVGENWRRAKMAEVTMQNEERHS